MHWSWNCCNIWFLCGWFHMIFLKNLKECDGWGLALLCIGENVLPYRKSATWWAMENQKSVAHWHLLLKGSPGANAGVGGNYPAKDLLVRMVSIALSGLRVWLNSRQLHTLVDILCYDALFLSAMAGAKRILFHPAFVVSHSQRSCCSMNMKWNSHQFIQQFAW